MVIAIFVTGKELEGWRTLAFVNVVPVLWNFMFCTYFTFGPNEANREINHTRVPPVYEASNSALCRRNTSLCYLLKLKLHKTCLFF